MPHPDEFHFGRVAILFFSYLLISFKHGGMRSPEDPQMLCPMNGITSVTVFSMITIEVTANKPKEEKLKLSFKAFHTCFCCF